MSDTYTIEKAIGNHEFVWERTNPKTGEPIVRRYQGFDHWEHRTDAVELEGVGSVRWVESEGGCEGDGEYTHLIFEVTEPHGRKRFFKKVGCYSSYDGSYWDGEFDEVHLVEKTVQVWESI